MALLVAASVITPLSLDMYTPAVPGMALAVLPWGDFVTGVGVLTVVFMAIALAAWILLLKSRIPLVCIKEDAPVKII